MNARVAIFISDKVYFRVKTNSRYSGFNPNSTAFFSWKTKTKKCSFCPFAHLKNIYVFIITRSPVPSVLYLKIIFPMKDLKTNPSDFLCVYYHYRLISLNLKPCVYFLCYIDNSSEWYLYIFVPLIVIIVSKFDNYLLNHTS